MLAAMWTLWVLYIFRKELRGWVVETYAQAHLEAEKRRMALYEEGFGEPPCCDECEPGECCEDDYPIYRDDDQDPYRGRQRFPKA